MAGRMATHARSARMGSVSRREIRSGRLAMTRRHVLTFVAIVAASRPVTSGVIGGFATEWTQLANNLQLINSYIRQGEELRQKILMVADMARNTANLPFQVFGPVMADIGSLAGVVQNGRALAYSMANLDAEFRN